MADQALVLDLSTHQRTARIDWAAVRADGVAGVILRAFEGKDLDPTFEPWRRAALEAGLLVGSYSYFRARHPGRWQAGLLLDALGGLGPGELPPALDLEDLDGRPTAEVISGALGWVDVVTQALGREPLVYTGPGFFLGQLKAGHVSELARCPLWLADYRERPQTPAPWLGWHLWQYTDRQPVAGITSARGEPVPVDASRWHGDEASLRAWASPPAPPQIDRGAVLGLVASTLDASIREGLDEARRGR